MEALRLSPELPERFARLYDYQLEKFETPLDDRGIADIDAICELAIRTYPDHLPPFTDNERNVHHVYWTEAFWKDYASQHSRRDADTILSFRNSTPQLAYVPKLLHWWIEQSMTPPPPPSLEVMRRRNNAWAAARILLKSAILLDQARADYETKKDNMRWVIGSIAGITPVSRQSDRLIEARVDREYWLSELNSRLDGWNKIADLTQFVPVEDRLITQPKLVHVWDLKRRIRNGAMVPQLPDELLSA